MLLWDGPLPPAIIVPLDQLHMGRNVGLHQMPWQHIATGGGIVNVHQGLQCWWQALQGQPPCPVALELSNTSH
jgi:hypothetical protein